MEGERGWESLCNSKWDKIELQVASSSSWLWLQYRYSLVSKLRLRFAAVRGLASSIAVLMGAGFVVSESRIEEGIARLGGSSLGCSNG